MIEFFMMLKLKVLFIKYLFLKLPNMNYPSKYIEFSTTLDTNH